MHVEGAGVALAYEEQGDGPATVLVHGMGARRAQGRGFPGRVIAYDRRGYGDSAAPQPYTRTTVHEHAEDLAALVGRLDAAPAVLVGADFGALVVLDAVLRHPDLTRGAVLVDPPVYAFVPQATEALSKQRAGLEDALRSGGPEAAVRWWRGGPAPPGSARGFFADFGALASLELSRAALRRVASPVGIVSSTGARPHDRAAAEALLDVLPAARRYEDVADAVRAVGA
jgi:pimeloyl-ACP methyl ester carboxylesterase